MHGKSRSHSNRNCNLLQGLRRKAMLIRKSEKVEGTCHFVDDVKHGAARTFRPLPWRLRRLRHHVRRARQASASSGICRVPRVRAARWRWCRKARRTAHCRFHARSTYGIPRRDHGIAQVRLRLPCWIRRSACIFAAYTGNFCLDVDGGKTCGGSRCSRFDR